MSFYSSRRGLEVTDLFRLRVAGTREVLALLRRKTKDELEVREFAQDLRGQSIGIRVVVGHEMSWNVFIRRPASLRQL
jgi:hypothetical protein